MEYALYFVCFIFGGALLLYAVLLALTRNIRLVPRTYAARIPDKEAYCKRIAACTMLVALALLAAGSIGLAFRPWVGFASLVPLVLLALWLGPRGTKDE